MKLRVLLFALLSACDRGGGIARIELVLPELPAETLEVRIRAEARADERTPGPIVASSAPFALVPGQGAVKLPKLDLPHGERLVAIVELARPEEERVLYYGVSEPFSLAPGQEVVVPVLVGFVEPPDGRVRIDASHPGFVRSPEVDLLLEVDTAAEVRVSNLLSFAESEVFAVGELEAATEGSRLAWSLDDALDLPCGESDYCLRQVFVRFIDPFGYEAPAKTSTIVVDTRAPSVRDAPAPSIRFTPSWEARRKLERAGAGTRVQVEFVLSEPTRAPPILTAVGPERIAFDACEGTALIDCAATLGDAPLEGTYVVEAALEDRAGNPANVPIVSFTVDTSPPRAPDPNLIIYLRTPWGSDATGDDSRFAVVGSPLAIDFGSTVLILDHAEYDGPTTQVVGSTGTPARADGSFPEIELTRTDRAEIYIVAVDEAGNRSESRRIDRVRWTATAGAGTPGSESNPHRIERLPLFFDRALLQESQLLATTSAADAALLARQDGLALVQPGRSVWSRRNQFGDSPGARFQHALAFDRERGRLVLFGGSNGPLYAGTREWDGDRWLRPVLGSVEPAPRTDAAMVFHASIGRTLLFGGTGSRFFDDTWTYDGRSWEPVASATAPSPRSGAAAAYDSARGVTVLHGGVNPIAALPHGDTWEFDGGQWAPVPIAGPSPERRNSAMAFDARRGRMVLFGGIHEDVGVIDVELGDTWEYDGATWTLGAQGGAMGPPARGYHAMAYDEAREAVILFGGSRDFNTTFGDAWEWVDLNGRMQWRSISGVLPPARANHAMAYAPAQERVIVFGGRSLIPPETKEDLWLLDARASVEATPGVVTPPARYDAATAYDPASAQTVLFGGTDFADELLDDTWIWDGWRWTEATSPNAAPYLAQPALAEHDGGLTLIGPETSALAIEVWRWTGVDWTRLTWSGTDPTPRQFPAIARDPARNEILLFGGGYPDAGGALIGSTDMFAWTGNAWRELSPANQPPPRFAHAMIADGTRRAVMVGGKPVPVGDPFDELWEWDGGAGDWSGPLSIAAAGGPSLRIDHALAYDFERGRVVLFGGAGASSDVLDDLWEWEGATDRWRRVEVAGAAPSVRFAPALVYDPGRARLVLFGGSNGVADTWELGRDANQRPAIHLAFNARSASIDRSAVEQIRLTVTASALDDGVRVLGWDAFAGEWIELAASFVTTSADDARRLIAADGFVHVAVEPFSGGADVSEIAVDAAELEVSYLASP